MRIYLNCVILLLGLSGCATPATSFLILNYNQAPKASSDTNQLAIENVSVSNNLFAALPQNLIVPAPIPIFVPGSGSARPEVRQGDPWSIVLSRVQVADADRGWFDGAPNIAVLLRVNTGDRSDIDGKWVLAAVQNEVTVPSFLNFDNLLVWSGITDRTITIDLQLVKLNKADKDRMAGYLSIASLISGAVPQYGPVANSIVKAGEAINAARDSYTVLLTYRAGFHAQHSLRYAAYALLPQPVARANAKTLWYDIKAPDEIKSGSESLNSNWCAFRIIKGSSRTFENGRADSLEKVRLLADQWIASENPAASLINLKEAVSNLVSSVEAARITSKIDFQNKASLEKALSAVKERQADPDPNMRLIAQDYNRFLQIVSSYLPPELMSGNDASIEKWQEAIGKLDTYHYDANSERWVKNS